MILVVGVTVAVVTAQHNQKLLANTETRIQSLRSKAKQLRETMAMLHQHFLLDLTYYHDQ